MREQSFHMVVLPESGVRVQVFPALGKACVLGIPTPAEREWLADFHLEVVYP